MDKFTFLAYAFAFLVAATAATSIPVMRRLKRNRAKRFKVICEQWLRSLNLAATDPSCDTGGSDFFSPLGEVYERECGGGWVIRYPLIKRYPDLGLTAAVDLIIHVYSLVPDTGGTIDTVFVDLAEPNPRWWHSQHRMSAFPKVTAMLHATKGRERKFSYASAIGDTLVSTC